MSVCDNINAGKYTNRMPRDLRKASYHDEERRVNDLFYRDICADLGLDPEKKSSEKLFQYAYDESHGNGLYDVYLKMCDLDAFVNEMVELRTGETGETPNA